MSIIDAIVEKVKRLGMMVDLLLLVSRANRDNIRALQEKYDFKKKRVCQIYIEELKTQRKFMLDDGQLVVFIIRDPVPDIIVNIKELCTIKHLRTGKKVGINPANNEKAVLRYTPWNAWKMGDIATAGDTSTNDMVAFMDIFTEIVANIPEEKVVEIIGACEHD